ncbi:unnamed protein product [Medioppia subpectinata]|uniref:Uncharacterized protein n=1 Tax=Medioppia subpectinata TaxID=1979941 RepID=A0A7R9KJ87_9ACAR|nr:unnamed protein product [Medioppia subpectinata]CAG2104530.1 unnamed protein product [Medioppia subpectinata]
MNCFVLLIFTFFAYLSVSNAITYCPLRETATTKLDATKTKNYYECPGHLPKHYSECCNDNRCCPSLTTSIYEIDQNLAFMIAVTVSMVCLIFAVFLLICCFCPTCPLYNSCKIRYTRDYAGCAHKMGETPLYSSMMPCDSPLGSTVVIAHPLRDKPNGYINDNKAKEAAV